jgi:hypothetical protein
MRFGQVVAVVAAMAAVTGCASVVDGSTQTISIATTPVSGASCTFANKRGEWSVVTPGTIIVKRSELTLHGHCTKDGYQEANEYIAAGTDNLSLAGTLAFGLVEAAVDASTGATSKYPDSFTIKKKPLLPAASNASAAANPAQSAVPSKSPDSNAAAAPRT